MKMMTKTLIASAGVMLSLLPLAAIAAPAKTAPAKKTAAAAATTYECTKCHMKVSAAVAKKDRYKDPMDGGALVPAKAAKK